MRFRYQILLSLALLSVLLLVVSGCGQREIGMLGFSVGESVECSQEGMNRIGMTRKTKQWSGFEEWLFTSDKPFRDFKMGKIVVDVKDGTIVQIRAGRRFTEQLDATDEYDRSLEAFKNKYRGEWKTTRYDLGGRLGLCSTCELGGGLSVDVNLVPYYDYSNVVLMMTDEERLGRERRKELERDVDSLK